METRNAIWKSRPARQARPPGGRRGRSFAALAMAAAWAGAGCAPTPSPPSSTLAVTVQRSPWADGGSNGQELATRHYRIYTTTAGRTMLEVLPGFLEGAYEHYQRLTVLAEEKDPKPMPVYMLGARTQWAVLTRHLTGPNSQVFLAIENGGYCYRGVCVFWDMGPSASLAIAGHEGLHQFFHHRLKDPLPAWVEEGLCTLAEGYNLSARSVQFTPDRNNLRMNDLRSALTGGRWMPLTDLLVGDAGDNVVNAPMTASEYYGQLWALLMYIRSQPRYKAGLEAMIADAADGRLRVKLNVPAAMGAGRTYSRSLAEPVFRRYITDDLPGFERACRLYAATLAKLR